MRDIAPEFAAALEGEILYPVLFYEIVGSTGTMRLWTGFGDTTWNGHTWAGVGWMIGQSAVEESADTKASTLTLGLPANAQVISTALAELKRGRPGTIWMGFRSPGFALGDPSGPWAIGDPALGLGFGAEKGALIGVEQVFAGVFDLAELDMDTAAPQVRLRYASRIADLERSRVRRQTPADQAIDYPGDKFFEYVGPLTDKMINWSGEKPSSGPTPRDIFQALFNIY